MYDFGIAFDIEDRLLELGADGVDGFEGVVPTQSRPKVAGGLNIWGIPRSPASRLLHKPFV